MCIKSCSIEKALQSDEEKLLNETKNQTHCTETKPFYLQPAVIRWKIRSFLKQQRSYGHTSCDSIKTKKNEKCPNT